MPEITARLSTALADRYRIERHLGEGGMATVYLAEDLKHERKVAVKVLRPELAAVLGAERFVQEIKTTANLQHPHILPLFDSGEADSFLYYVMPFIDGETLRDKLNRETQLGIEEAVSITTSIADALDYAHRNDVIHRDIKPENILLHDGRPMVADFGIALALSAAAGGRMTETGLSLGTPHYMSPEQATAEKDLTHRADIYSLGSVLYEMLTGEPPHIGGSAQAIIMKIVTEPAEPVTKIRKSVPPNITAAVAKSLEKLAADRFTTAAEFAAALADPHFIAATVIAPGSQPIAIQRSTMAGWAVAGVLAVLLGWVVLKPEPGGTSAIPMRFTLEMVGAENLRLNEIEVSPDGSVFALPTLEGIYLRSANDPTYRLLPDTEKGIEPTFSPDSKWLAFIRDGVLYKVGVEGGSASSLTRTSSVVPAQPNWGAPGTIVFQSRRRLYRVSDAGGEPELIGGDVTVDRPYVLPDGSAVLYGAPDGAMLLEFEADAPSLVIPWGSDVKYIDTGHLTYIDAREGGLYVVPFDLQARTVTGTPIPILNEVSNTGTYSISRTGTLLYATNPLSAGSARHLLLMDLRGGLDTIPLAPRTFNWPSFSPDGRWLSFNTGAGRTAGRVVYTYDLISGSMVQITQEPSAHDPVWSPDGTHLVFSSEQSGTLAEDLFIVPVDGSASPEHVIQLAGDDHAMAWPTNDSIVVASDGMTDLFVVDLTGAEPQARPFLSAEWQENELSISPDGTSAVYSSDETGRWEAYVRRFPNASDPHRISTDGGRAPAWAPDGRAAYYWSVSLDTLFRVPMRNNVPEGAPSLVDVVPRRLGGWDIDRISGRAVVMQVVEDEGDTSPQLIVVVNFFEELKAKVGN